MGYSTSAPNERVWRIMQLATLSFNHPSVVLTADFFQYRISTPNERIWCFFNWKTSAVSTTDGRLRFNFASCVIRQTRSLGALVPYFICSTILWCLWFKSTIWLLILSSTSFTVGRSRVFYIYRNIFLMKDIGRWLPWLVPGSTGWFYKDDAVRDHSAHGYYITRIEGGVRYAWYCYVSNRIEQNAAKTSPI